MVIGRLALGMVPLWGWLAAAGLVVAGGAAWHYAALGDARDEGRAEVQVKWDRERAANTSAALLATAEARAEERRRNAAQQENANEVERLAARDRAAALRTAPAVDRLRQRTDPLAAACDRAAGYPAAAGELQTAPGPGYLLADVQRRLVEAARRIAAEADKRRTGGLGCQLDYETLDPHRP